MGVFENSVWKFSVAFIRLSMLCHFNINLSYIVTSLKRFLLLSFPASALYTTFIAHLLHPLRFDSPDDI
jgi:hypothetical protein